MMWVDEHIVGFPTTGQLPFRVTALLEAATKAGLGLGRTSVGLLNLLREQSRAIHRRWKIANLMEMEATVASNEGFSSMNRDNLVAMLVDTQRDCKEMRLVSPSL